MKKRLIALATCLLLAMPVQADFDYSLLDSLTLEEMENLRNELTDRIDQSKQKDIESTGIWKVRYYIDEFKQPTDEGYISTVDFLEGTFSNTATTNSLLYAMPIIDDKICFKLLEYGDNVVKGYFSDGHDYDISVLSPSGEKYTMKGSMYKGSDRVVLDAQYTPYFCDILNENGCVKISMKEKGYNSKYYFEIPDSSFFSNAYLQLFDSIPHHNSGTADEIDPEYDVSITLEGDVPTVNVLTNLPDGINVIVTLVYAFQNPRPAALCEITDGRCSVTFDDVHIPSYMEDIRVIIGISSDQPEEIFEVYGESMDKIIGPHEEDITVSLR